MYRITKCDLCFANSCDYEYWIRKSVCLRPLENMHVVDINFFSGTGNTIKDDWLLLLLTK